jgi:hypothetical protein
MQYEYLFLQALALTVLVECAVVVLFVRRVWAISSITLSLPRLLFAAFFTSFATIPYLWFILPLWRAPYLFRTVAGELLVTVIEALAYVFLLDLKPKRAALLSLAANLASILAGLILM